MTDDPFVTHRGLLFTVAYEMLGSAVDAEDVVQETWLRWADVDQAEVRDPRAYLVRIVTRQALNRLRTVSRRREDYVGEWLPEPLLTSPDVAEDAELAENVSIAMLTVLETFGPAERAVFVLHEVFETPYDEIAEVVGKTPAAVRQIAHRAREHVAAQAAADAGGPSPAGGDPREVHGRHLLRRRAGTGGGPRPGRGVGRRRRRPGRLRPASPSPGSRGWRRSWPGWRISRTWWRPLPGSTGCRAPGSTSVAKSPRSVWWSRTAGSPGSTPSATRRS